MGISPIIAGINRCLNFPKRPSWLLGIWPRVDSETLVGNWSASIRPPHFPPFIFYYSFSFAASNLRGGIIGNDSFSLVSGVPQNKCSMSIFPSFIFRISLFYYDSYVSIFFPMLYLCYIRYRDVQSELVYILKETF